MYKKILLLVRDLMILIVIGNLISFFMNPDKSLSSQPFLMNTIASILYGYPLWKGNEYLIKLLDRKVPWLKYPFKRLMFQFTGMIVFSAIVIITITFIYFKLALGYPDDTFMFMSIQSMKIAVILLIFSALITNSVFFFLNWKQSAVQQEKLKLEHLALQYETLKNQVNPHFLFNSLNSLTSLIEKDQGNAVLFVKKLSEVYRYVLDQKDNELVPVGEEMKFLESYIFLQKIRFGENLTVDLKVDAQNDRKVIPLSLQMMVENAIKHNVIAKGHPLHIEIYSPNREYIVVKNNIQRKSSDELSTGLGIENLKKRYEFLTSKSLVISGGTDYFIVEIPFVTSRKTS